MTSHATIFSPAGFLADHTARFPSKRPLPRGVEEALRLGYLVSLETEEGRPVRFALVLADDPRDLPHLLPLAEPESVTLELLRRLSPAVDGYRACLVASGGEQTGLRLRGMCGRPFTDDWTLEKELPNAVIVVRGPGRVDLDFMGAVTRFERGVTRTLTPGSEVLAGVPEPILTWHVDFAGRLIPGEPFPGEQFPSINVGSSTRWCERDLPAGHIEHLLWSAQRVVPEVLLQWMELIITNVQRLGHGASVLVLPPGFAGRDFCTAGRTLAPTPDPFINAWNDGLLRKECWNTHYDLSRMDEKVLWPGAKKKDEAHRWGNDQGYDEVRSAHDAMTRDAARIARLTQIDGGLVVDHGFQPVILGATFAQDAAAAKTGGGHRRKSLRWAVGRVPDSFGLLVSQDGNAWLVHQGDGGSVEELELAL